MDIPGFSSSWIVLLIFFDVVPVTRTGIVSKQRDPRNRQLVELGFPRQLPLVPKWIKVRINILTIHSVGTATRILFESKL